MPKSVTLGSAAASTERPNVNRQIAGRLQIGHIPRRPNLLILIGPATEEYAFAFCNTHELTCTTPPTPSLRFCTYSPCVCDLKHGTIFQCRADQGVLEMEG